MVRVADTGTGIRPEDLDKVFDPFFTTKPAGEGNGLGLMVCKGIVGDHGGTIDVASEPGAGTEFRIRLPPGRAELPVGARRPSGCERIWPSDAAAAAVGARQPDGFARWHAACSGERRRDAQTPDRRRRQRDAADARVALPRAGLRRRSRPSRWTRRVARLRDAEYDAVLSDIKMPGRSGIELVGELRRLRPETPIVLMTAFGSIDSAVEAMRAGAFDYVTKPFEPEAVLFALERAFERRALEEENRSLRRAVDRTSSFGELIGESPAMREIFALIRQVAHSRSSVLITGESGTGKEVVARTLHFAGPRAQMPFVPDQLHGDPGGPARERAVRPRARRLHRRARHASAACSRRRTAARSSSTRSATWAPASRASSCACSRTARSARSAARSRSKVDVRIVAATHKDLDGRDRGGPLPRGSLLPAQRDPDPHPAAARAPGGHPAAGERLPAPARRERTPQRVAGGARAAGGLPVARQRARARERDRARARALRPRGDRGGRPAARRAGRAAERAGAPGRGRPALALAAAPRSRCTTSRSSTSRRCCARPAATTCRPRASSASTARRCTAAPSAANRGKQATRHAAALRPAVAVRRCCALLCFRREGRPAPPAFARRPGARGSPRRPGASPAASDA